jgi:hypothetical protein
MYQHPSDWYSNTGVIRQADEQGMGIILMRLLTSGVFQRLMAEAFPEIDVLDVGRLLLNYVLSDSYVDVALVGDDIESQAHQALTNLGRIPESDASLFPFLSWRIRICNNLKSTHCAPLEPGGGE